VCWSTWRRELGEARLDRRYAKRLINLPVHAFDDLFGRSRRHGDVEPARRQEIRVASFDDGRHVGQQRVALGADHYLGADLIGLDHRQHRRQRVDRAGDAAADNVRQQRA